jgi:hypothetical protein
LCRIVAVVSLVLTGPVYAQLETPGPPADGAELCASHDGAVVTRYPAGGANNPETMQLFALVRDFCEFTAEDGSSISVPLDVLAASGATIAAIAYYYPPMYQSTGTPGANPSYIYCDQLAGAINFGLNTTTGSGFVSVDDPSDFRTYCVFADGSMIDSFGIFYHSNGIIRGKDLNGVLAWPGDENYAGFFGR